ncbi:MAG: CvpA family protein [Oscillospiraceae bacterium]|nr:CvpA family protein [Oscillospiraceae bacterium]
MLVLGIDLAIIGTVAFCGWRGYSNGLIRGVFGVVTLVLSLFAASVAASAYSDAFSDLINPFVSGVIDTALVDILDNDMEHDPSIFEGKSENYSTAYKALRRIGLPQSPAMRVAELATSGRSNEGIPETLLSDYLADRLSSVLAFVAVFGIAFVLMGIIFAVIGNLINFVFSLPGLALVDSIAGAAFGTAKGLLIVFVLATVVRYVGLIAPNVIESTKILKYIVNNNPIANVIGI